MRRTEEKVLPGGARVRMRQLGARAAGDLMRRLVNSANAGGGFSVGTLGEEDFAKLFDLALESSEIARTPRDASGAELEEARTWARLVESDLHGFPDTMALLDLCLRINILDFLVGRPTSPADRP